MQLLGGENICSPSHFSYWGVAAPPRPPLYTPLLITYIKSDTTFTHIKTPQTINTDNTELQLLKIHTKHHTRHIQSHNQTRTRVCFYHMVTQCIRNKHRQTTDSTKHCSQNSNRMHT